MSLENPAIKISDWQNMTNRLATLEAVLGMTNKSVLADAAGDVASSLFLFDAVSMATGDVRFLVKTAQVTLNTALPFTNVDFTFPELPNNFVWKIYPLVGAVRAVSYTGAALPRQYLRAIIEGGPTSTTYYAASDKVTVKTFLQDSTNLAIGPGGSMDVVVTLVAFCTRG